MTKQNPTPGSDGTAALRPMLVDELVTAAAQRPHQYSGDWFSANKPERVFTLTDLRKHLYDLNRWRGGEWSYERREQ
jgi:hypothetical protein